MPYISYDGKLYEVTREQYDNYTVGSVPPTTAQIVTSPGNPAAGGTVTVTNTSEATILTPNTVNTSPNQTLPTTQQLVTPAPATTNFGASVQTFEDGTTLQTFDDGSVLAVGTDGSITSAPATSTVDSVVNAQTVARAGLTADQLTLLGAADATDPYIRARLGLPALDQVQTLANVLTTISAANIVSDVGNALHSAANTVSDAFSGLFSSSSTASNVTATTAPADNNFATTTVTFDDGTTLTTFDDGSVLATGTDGSITSSPAPSDAGTTTTVTADGTVITTNDAGQVDVQGYSADTTQEPPPPATNYGTTTVTYDDGTTLQTFDDGSALAVGTDGSITTAPASSNDAITTTIYDDGSVLTTYEDGTVSATPAIEGTNIDRAPADSNYGTTIQTFDDGTTLQTFDDGSVLATGTDGSISSSAAQIYDTANDASTAGLSTEQLSALGGADATDPFIRARLGLPALTEVNTLANAVSNLAGFNSIGNVANVAVSAIKDAGSAVANSVSDLFSSSTANAVPASEVNQSANATNAGTTTTTDEEGVTTTTAEDGTTTTTEEAPPAELDTEPDKTNAGTTTTTFDDGTTLQTFEDGTTLVIAPDAPTDGPPPVDPADDPEVAQEITAQQEVVAELEVAPQDTNYAATTQTFEDGTTITTFPDGTTLVDPIEASSINDLPPAIDPVEYAVPTPDTAVEVPASEIDFAPADTNFATTTQTFDDGTTLQTFDDGSVLATATDNEVTSAPADTDPNYYEQGVTEDVPLDQIETSPAPSDFGGSVQTFDDGTTLQTFDDGSVLATDTEGNLSSSPSPVDSDIDAQIGAAQDAEDAAAGVGQNPAEGGDGAGSNSDAAAAGGNIQGLVKNAQQQQTIADQRKQINNGDWRVRLRLAPQARYLYNAKNPGIMAPLSITDGVIFPYTPQIDTVYRASYDTYDLTHSNYRGYFYKNSYVDAVNIKATFTAQDTNEANYLLAVITFFKSATKMFYGQDTQRGAPPPVLYLSGLGDYQFREQSCLLSQFTYSLPDNVDYIRSGSPNNAGLNFLNVRDRQNVATNSIFGQVNRLANAFLPKGAQTDAGAPPTLGLNRPTYVPTKLDINLTLLPIQSRDQISKQFSLQKFANGDLIKGGFW